MAKDLWAESENDEVSGEYVQQNNDDFPVIPHGERVKVIIDKALWESKVNYKNQEKEEDCISLRFEIEDGEFKGQKLFKKCFIESAVEDQQNKDWNFFSAVDINAGGKCRALKRKPNNDELSRYLINKTMVIIVGLMKAKTSKDKDNNYVMGVSGGKGAQKPAQKTPDNQIMDDDQDIPF